MAGVDKSSNCKGLLQEAHVICAGAVNLCQVSVGVLAAIDLCGVWHVRLATCACTDERVSLPSLALSS